MGIELWLVTGFMVGLFVFTAGYAIWEITVGRKRRLPGEIRLVSSDDRSYLSQQPYYIPLSRNQKKQALQKKNLQLLERIGFILLIFLGVGIYQKQNIALLLIVVGIFAGMYGLGILYYRIITAGGIYEVKAVCMNITPAGRGDGDLQYDFAFYDYHTAALEGAMLVTRRKDMKEIVEAGMRTHLLLIVRRGRWRVFEWKE